MRISQQKWRPGHNINISIQIAKDAQIDATQIVRGARRDADNAQLQGALGAARCRATYCHSLIVRLAETFGCMQNNGKSNGLLEVVQSWRLVRRLVSTLNDPRSIVDMCPFRKAYEKGYLDMVFGSKTINPAKDLVTKSILPCWWWGRSD